MMQNLWAYAAGTGSTSPDSRKADEWIKNYLDEKNKRLNDLRQTLHNKLDHPPALDEYMRPEMKAAWRADKPPSYIQNPKRVAGGGKWAVVSPDDEIISTWKTEKEATQAAFALYKGLSPSSTGATAGAKVKRISEMNLDVNAADIFQDPDHGDETRSKFIKHPKPKSVQLADQLRMGDRRPSSHGQGSAGTGGAGGPGGGS